MGNVKLLDCTLRDGGYINNWEFGEKAIPDMIEKLVESNVDILELGFLKDEPYLPDRTVFCNMSQISELIKPKKPGLLYAAMIEVVNPIPLEMLAPRTHDTVDIIRVIVWKTKHTADGKTVDALEEGFEYCKGVVERGYKLCVQPARVDQYSDEEFAEMVKKFSTLNPYAIYVVDSWGTQNSENLLHYMHIADDVMPGEISLGYHGHNNMMQAFGAAQAMINAGFERNIIIDASVYGIGRGAGNLNTEIIAEYLNVNVQNKYKTELFLNIYRQYISMIYSYEPWGYSIPFYLTAKNNCNPAYASLYGYQYHLSISDIDELLHDLPKAKKTIYNEKYAQEYFFAWHRKRWNKKICVVLPTANRPEDIHHWLQLKSREYSEFGIDLIIYDSSSDDKTKKIVEKFANRKLSTTKYYRYDGFFDGISIDHKVIELYKELSKSYDYIWPCRDGHLINIWNLDQDLWRILNKKPDLITVYDGPTQNIDNLEAELWYTKREDLPELLKYHARHMTILGCSIVSSEFIQKVIEEQPLDNNKNYSLWQPFAYFHYWDKHEPNMVSYVGTFFSINAFATPSSHWNKKGKALWQWGERWYTLVNNLPNIYNSEKNTIMKIGMADFTPFQPWQLMIMRANGSLTLKTYKENKIYLDHVTEIAGWKFKAFACVPRFICQSVLHKPDSIISKLSRKAYNSLKKIYHSVKKRPERPVFSYPAYFLGGNVFEHKNSEHMKFKEKQFAVFIITNGRMDVIQAHLNAAAQSYCEYGADIYIIDSGDNLLLKTEVQKWNSKYPEKIHYIGDRTKDLSYDKKVISIYKKFSDLYDYIWITKDSCGLRMQNCIIKLLESMKQQKDFIILGNFDDNYHRLGSKKYSDCQELFDEQFAMLTKMEHIIVNSCFVKKVIAEEPLDSNKNEGFWYVAALFAFCARHKFQGTVYYNDLLIYHMCELQNVDDTKRYIYHWVKQFYTALHMLPSVYSDLLHDVIIEWNTRYHLLERTGLLFAHACNELTKQDISEYEDIIPFVSYTQLKDYYFISNMSKKEAFTYLEHLYDPKYSDRFSITDNSNIGSFEAIGKVDLNE